MNEYRKCTRKFEFQFVNRIPVDFRFDILCFAIAKGNQDHWDFLWNRYLNSRDRTEREEILQAIGCSQDVRLLNR